MVQFATLSCHKSEVDMVLMSCRNPSARLTWCGPRVQLKKRVCRALIVEASDTSSLLRMQSSCTRRQKLFPRIYKVNIHVWTVEVETLLSYMYVWQDQLRSLN